MPGGRGGGPPSSWLLIPLLCLESELGEAGELMSDPVLAGKAGGAPPPVAGPPVVAAPPVRVVVVLAALASAATFTSACFWASKLCVSSSRCSSSFSSKSAVSSCSSCSSCSLLSSSSRSFSSTSWVSLATVLLWASDSLSASSRRLASWPSLVSSSDTRSRRRCSSSDATFCDCFMAFSLSWAISRLRWSLDCCRFPMSRAERRISFTVHLALRQRKKHWSTTSFACTVWYLLRCARHLAQACRRVALRCFSSSSACSRPNRPRHRLWPKRTTARALRYLLAW
mmetsp:Transcript_6162/g.9333  ORF Transcript_6162/g.9333 Transcript_6162/m.9333 type:complete len:284 (-) Transcript_6162:2839-3690(-)